MIHAGISGCSRLGIGRRAHGGGPDHPIPVDRKIFAYVPEIMLHFELEDGAAKQHF
jgi:hypothetical protein